VRTTDEELAQLRGEKQQMLAALAEEPEEARMAVLVAEASLLTTVLKAGDIGMVALTLAQLDLLIRDAEVERGAPNYYPG
jgi:hypothetical protein